MQTDTQDTQVEYEEKHQKRTGGKRTVRSKVIKPLCHALGKAGIPAYPNRPGGGSKNGIHVAARRA
ncbi:hypothetical protein DOT_0959 [Desulfosporosinus sp. OT]|nr:hypothetical protein DOT_0959 [Desulfosporosinus sp. OT]